MQGKRPASSPWSTLSHAHSRLPAPVANSSAPLPKDSQQPQLHSPGDLAHPRLAYSSEQQHSPTPFPQDPGTEHDTQTAPPALGCFPMLQGPVSMPPGGLASGTHTAFLPFPSLPGSLPPAEPTAHVPSTLGSRRPISPQYLVSSGHLALATALRQEAANSCVFCRAKMVPSSPAPGTLPPAALALTLLHSDSSS